MTNRYQLFASDLTGITGTFAECVSILEATARCVDEFPFSEGWFAHYVLNLDTNREYLCIEPTALSLDD